MTANVASVRRTAYRGLGACLLAALAAVVAAGLVARSAEARQLALRELRIEAQRLERQVRLLDAPRAETTLAALGESRDALRVRIVEALGAAHRAPAVERLRYDIDERATSDGEEVATLRLSLEGRLAHGAALLDLLAVVRTATRPWPSETRGCLLQRLAAAGMLVDCAVDVLHWRRLRAPGSG